MNWSRCFASAAGEHAICSFVCPTIFWIIGLGFLDMQSPIYTNPIVSSETQILHLLKSKGSPFTENEWKTLTGKAATSVVIIHQSCSKPTKKNGYQMLG